MGPSSRHAFCPFPSHQTTKFPPTPSIRSTSASHVRMIKLQYSTFTVIHISATIPCDSPRPHILAFLLFTVHYSPLRCLSPRTRRKCRKPFPFMRLLHNSRIPRGRGSPAFLRELCALCVKIAPLPHLARSVWHPEPPARTRFGINVRSRRIKSADAGLKSFRCNVYRKTRGRVPSWGALSPRVTHHLPLRHP